MKWGYLYHELLSEDTSSTSLLICLFSSACVVVCVFVIIQYNSHNSHNSHPRIFAIHFIREDWFRNISYLTCIHTYDIHTLIRITCHSKHTRIPRNWNCLSWTRSVVNPASISANEHSPHTLTYLLHTYTQPPEQIVLLNFSPKFL